MGGTEMTIEEARKKAQRIADGSDKPAYIVKVKATGATMVVMIVTAAMEIIDTVQPEA
jgi:chemotaxis regulatin CheY-phosphate phosphatase CheZ